MDRWRPFDRALAGLSRRQLLNVAWYLGTSALLLPATSRGLWAKPIFHHYPFTLGVASGDPAPDGVVLWTRLAPEPLAGGGMPMADVEVAFEVARDDGFADIVQSGTALARPEFGHAVHVELSGLEPGRVYWYRFIAGDEVSPTGRTKTAPAAGAPVDRLRFAFCGCNHFETGYFTAFRELAREDLDFVFHTGDYIYEYRASGGEEPRVRQHHGDEIYTITDYRNRYAQYKADPDFKAAHAAAPFIVTWDDHEVDNNWAAAIDQDGTPPEVFVLRRAAAYQAYYETMPLRRASLPTSDHLQLYRRLDFGGLMAFNALDTRQYRSDQACGDGYHDDCAEAAAPGRTMLGEAQERWLDDQLRRSGARWNVLAQQIPIFGRNFAAADQGGTWHMDKWDGYLAARDRLMTTLEERGPGDVVFLSGDVHSHWGADVPARLEQPDGAKVAVEFTNSSASSGGDGSDVRDYWEKIQPDNPHIRYHSNRRGYVTCEVTPERWRTDFKVLDRVEVPDGTLTTGGSLVVEHGEPRAQKA